jgi:hypothetical protein
MINEAFESSPHLKVSKEREKMKQHITILAIATVTLILSVAVAAQVVTYPTGRGTDRQTRTLLTQIENETATFRAEVMSPANRGAINVNRDERLDNLIDQFSTATTDLSNQYNSRRDMTVEVNNVLERASAIDRFMQRTNLSARAESQWSTLRTDLETLARYNNVSWNWNNGDTYDNRYPNNSGRYPNPSDNNRYPSDTYGGYRQGPDSRLTGTYRLNYSQSDNVADILDRALGRNYSTTQPNNMRRGLERRLTPPEMLAFEKLGSRVTMASTLAPQVTFDADGVPRTETNARGRVMTTTARVDRSGLSIQYQGERANDFNVTFAPSINGQLRVTRTVYIENQARTVSVTSVYDKTDSIARWSQVNVSDNTAGNYPGGYDNSYPNPNGRFAIPNGTRLTARLDSNISTRASQSGDRFTMTVTSPYQYNGAQIEGHVESAANSGRVTGRANMTLVLDSVRLANGERYRFAGTVDSVRAVNGDTVSVNNEGTIRDQSQTTKTATRAGVGAVIGAIIGAVAGGGQGAAIGAAVGAGAGAGSVLLQGRDNIELAPGSQFMITASTPVGASRIP